MEKAQKESVIHEYRAHETDTGSTEVQVAILTHRINQLTRHLRVHRKDFHTRRGLLSLVGQRRRMLRYVNRNDVRRYKSLINRLGIRR